MWPNCPTHKAEIVLLFLRTAMKPLLSAIGASLIACGALAQSASPDVPAIIVTPNAVVAIVRVPKPWYAPRFLAVSKMKDTLPQYEKLPGLNYKIFALAQADGQFGGIYLWRDRTAAQNWFSPAWHERVLKERGYAAHVQFYKAPVVVTNAPAIAGSAHIATLVTITKPAQVTQERLVNEFAAAAPIYQKVPGLLRKYFIITDDGKFGGVYLWDTQASAEQWFNPAWHERVRKTYGTDANIEWFDAPIIAASTLADNRLEITPP
jgi:heme-degrading monooxygenase HmoA